MSYKKTNKANKKKILVSLVSIFGTLLLSTNALSAPDKINNEVVDINVNEEVKVKKVDTNITDNEVNKEDVITNNSNFLSCDADRDCKINEYLPLGVQIGLSLIGLVSKNGGSSNNNVYDRGIAGIEVPGKPALVDPATLGLRIRAVPTSLPAPLMNFLTSVPGICIFCAV